MNFGDRERVIMPSNGTSFSGPRARPRRDDAQTDEDLFALALGLKTPDPFDELIRLESSKAVGLHDDAPPSAPEQPSQLETVRAESVDARVDAAKIRAEARQWGQSHVKEADSVATQRLLEAEFEARRIVEQARVGARQIHAETRVAEQEAPAPARAQSEPELAQPTKRRRTLGIVAAVALVLAIAVGAVLIRTYVAQPFSVESSSMEPALHQGDRLIVNKVAYRVGDPQRGDVIVIDTRSVPGAPPSIPKTVVKRVVGLPGEAVSAVDGRLFIDGSPIDQPWLGDVQTPAFGPVVLPPGAFFVLGDNRSSSIDSRNFGAVPSDAIIGRVEGVMWPLRDVGRV